MKPDEETKEDIEQEECSKWDLMALRQKFKEMGLPWDDTMKKIKDLCVKTVISVEHHMSGNYNRYQRDRGVCFEIYGFDVLLD